MKLQDARDTGRQNRKAILPCPASSVIKPPGHPLPSVLLEAPVTHTHEAPLSYSKNAVTPQAENGKNWFRQRHALKGGQSSAMAVALADIAHTLERQILEKKIGGFGRSAS